MSNLGIRFVLPYIGSNGLKVTNNLIGLDPSGYGQIGALDVNKNGSQGGLNPAGFGSLLAVWNDITQTDNPVNLIDIPTNKAIALIDSSGSYNNGSAIGSPYEGELVTDLLQTLSQILAYAGSFNNSAIQIIAGIGSPDLNINNIKQAVTGSKTSGAVVLDATHYLPIEVNGITYKILIST